MVQPNPLGASGWVESPFVKGIGPSQLSMRNSLDICALASLLVLVGCSEGGDPSAYERRVVQTPDLRTPSVARLWNEALLQAIRRDFARPTMHARNLFHVSAAMYDAWAIYADAGASTYLAGKQLNGYTCTMSGIDTGIDRQPARERAISYAAYRLIRHRFANSPGAQGMWTATDQLMSELGFDPAVTSTEIGTGPAAVGNRIAQCYIEYGLQDGANEAAGYANRFYQPVNPPIEPPKPGNPAMVDLDRWQPIALVEFIDQSGNLINSQPPFLSAEWGAVAPFALTAANRTTYVRDGFNFNVYHDPGPPPSVHGIDADLWKWAHELTAIWSGHLDASDGVMMDISPASLGNVQYYPTTFDEFPAFYDTLNGGDHGIGHAMNPVTGAPYAPQVVRRGDYTRVLAEFWADGPASETPPGHWFVIFNTVNDHPQLERRMGGAGPQLGPLEWDVKGYFTLGGAMHDSAIAAWGIKGWYDSSRPVSAIRAMADRGQSSDPAKPSYHPDGLPLVPGHVELVEPGDPLAGPANEHVGKIKLYAWRGPQAVTDPLTSVAGAGWILAEHWWTYQLPTFVSPPFAGYVSGHSTFSRAAAEVLTALTGDEYFPGGLGEFRFEAHEYLSFEDGPSTDVTLQWATYRDAADQVALSRIWGGIHPPIDDLPGRTVGREVGRDAYAVARSYFGSGD